MSIDPYGTIRAQVLDLQGNAVGGAVSNNDWRLVVDNENLVFQHYDATANDNAGAYITRQSFGTGLTGISVVPLGTYSITGNLQVTDDLTVDGGTLFVDSSTNRVGFGTLTPSQVVHIVGNTYLDGDLTVTGSTSLSSSSVWTKDGTTNEIYYTTANVGIGTNNPDSSLHVNGTSKFVGNMTLTGDVSLTGHIVPAANNTYDLGSATNTFRHVYVGPGSLYVNGKQVITDDSNTITVSTSINQNLALKTSGTGNLQVSTVGTGDIEITAGGIVQMKKTLQILDGQKITSSGGTTVVCGNNFQSEGSLRGVTLTLDGSTSIGPSQLNVLADATVGSGVAFKAVVLDTNKDFSGIRNLSLTGDLTVAGTTTTVNSTTVSVADGMFKYAANNAANATDFGWYGKYVDSSVTYYSGMFRDATDNKMRFFTSTQVEPTTTVDITGTGYAKADVVVGDVDFTSGTMRGHILPDVNDAYDIGSAEFKIRDMYVSDSSLWVGDNHKITIDSGGKMKFRKRKTSTVPAAVSAAGGTEAGAKTHSGKASLSLMKLKDWKAYMRSLPNQGSAKIKDIFRATADDYEEETGADAWLESGNNVYLGASGNVGIGDSTPTEKLEVNGAIKIGDAATTGDGTIKYASGDFLGRKAGSWVSLTAAGGGSSVWTEASSEAYYLGNVGIGTNNPSAPLHIKFNNTTDGQLLIEPVDTTGQTALMTIRGHRNASTNNVHAQIIFENYDDDLSASNKLGMISGRVNNFTTNIGDLVFTTYADGSTESERMRITSDGNVGIGTTSPSQKLHVYGNPAIIEPAAGQQIALTTPGGETGIVLDGTNANNRSRFDIKNIANATAGSRYFRMKYNADSTGLTIQKGGNVGIGNTSPTEKLTVNGAIKIGDAATTGDGTIKYASGDFLGRKAGSWVSLTAAGGGSSVWTEASSEAYYLGNVGIGTNNPTEKVNIESGIHHIDRGYHSSYQIYRETFPNSTAVGDIGTWTTSDAVAWNTGASKLDDENYLQLLTNGAITSPTLTTLETRWKYYKGSVIDNEVQNSTRVLIKCMVQYYSLDTSDEIAQIQFTNDNGTTWNTVWEGGNDVQTSDERGWHPVVADITNFCINGGTHKIRIRIDASGTGDYFYVSHLSVVLDDSTPWYLMNFNNINVANNVGIGTTNPSYKLDVTGDINLTGNLRINGVAQTFGGGTSFTKITETIPGTYGSISTTGSGGSGNSNWEGYSINGRYVFMSQDDSNVGIYNDIDNKWLNYYSRSSSTSGYWRWWTGGSEALRLDFGTLQIKKNNNTSKLDMTGGGDGYYLYNSGNNLDFYAKNTVSFNRNESYFRLGGSGIINVYTEHNSSGVPCIQMGKKHTSSTNQQFIRFYRHSSSISDLDQHEGDLRTNGSGNLAFQNPSDQRLKEGIIDYENGYNKVKNLRTVEFEWIEAQKKQEIGRVVGFIAQEVEQVLPKSVDRFYPDEENLEDYTYQFSSAELIPFNWSATRTLINKVEALEAENNTLKTKVSTLESELAAIKTHLGL